MIVAVAADHRGFQAKRRLIPLLKQWGFEVMDFGCDGSTTATDYPDYAIPAAKAVADGRCSAGIFMDGSGIGMSVAANKVIGVRAALAHDEVTARLSREHNHCNVLCLGSDLLSESQMRKIAEIFLETRFSSGRHERRVEKLKQFERSQCFLPVVERPRTPVLESLDTAIEMLQMKNVDPSGDGQFIT